jgi:hypothetical protein
MKIILQGLEDSGKSLRLAMVATTLVERNSKWRQQTGRVRPIYSNMHFSKPFMLWAQKKRVEIHHWKNLQDILFLDDVDIIMDEVVKYFDARKFAELSQEAKTWLTQSSKRGVEIYGATQDFSLVDVIFRRLVGGRGGLFHIRKLVGSRRPSATKPPVKHIWGLCSMNELDPVGYDSATSQFKPKNLFPRFFLISRQYCEVFDTKQKIEQGQPPPLHHVERLCEKPNCEFKRVTHA